MTVGAEGDMETGMLFATAVSTRPIGMRKDSHASVESSCRMRPAYSTRRNAGDGGCAGEDHSDG